MTLLQSSYLCPVFDILRARKEHRKAFVVGVSYSALGISASELLHLGSCLNHRLLQAAPDLLNENRSGRPRYQVDQVVTAHCI